MMTSWNKIADYLQLVTLASVALIAGCGGDDAVNNKTLPEGWSSACTVIDSPDEGQSIIRCADGTSAIVQDGRPGLRGDDAEACVIEAGADDTQELVCPDGSKTTIDSTSSCTIVAEGDDKILRCADGTEANLGDGSGGPITPGGDCDILKGNLWVNNALDVAQLQGAGCAEVTGDLLIEAADLPDIKGLSKLTSVGGELIIKNNSALTTLEGLENLTSVGRGIRIEANQALTSIEALAKIGGVNKVNLQHITLRANPALTSLKGLEGVEQVGQLIVDDLEALTSLEGLEGLRTMGEGGVITLRALPALTSVAALGELNADPASLVLDGLDELASLQGLGGMKKIGDLHIQNVGKITDLTALAPDYITGELVVRDNAALTSVAGLEVMNYLAPNGLILTLGDLIIEGNPELTTLEGLKTIQIVEGDILVHQNAKLTALWRDAAGFGDSGPSRARRLIIRDNDALLGGPIYDSSAIFKEVIIEDNDALTSLGRLSLLEGNEEDRPDRVVIRNNAALTSTMNLEVNELKELIIEGNSSLTSLTLFNLLVRERLRVVENNILNKCQAYALSTPSSGERPAIIEIWGNNGINAAMCP